MIVVLTSSNEVDREAQSWIASGKNSLGLVVIPDASTVTHRAEVTSLTDRYSVPAVFWSRSFAELNGLISYGPVLIDEYQRAASDADRILKGEKPSRFLSSPCQI
jgi:putative ABC transport system substrate-binding protein